MKGVLILYNSELDKEVFSILRTTGYVTDFMKWENVKGTGSSSLKVIGPIEEAIYNIALVILSEDNAKDLFEQIKDLRKKMLKKVGVISVIFPVDAIG